MSFLLPFLNFLQPGILWPELAALRPMLVVSALALLLGLRGASTYSRREAWRSKQFFWLVLFIVAQALSLHRSGVGEMLSEFGYWYVFLLFVVISVLLIRDEKTLQRYVWGTMLGALFLVGYGIYIVFARGGYQGTGRAGAYGMYENHNDYTFVIIQILPYLYLFWRREKGLVRRTVLVIGLVACLVGVALSMSRGGMIALVVEVALIVILGMQGRRRFWLLPIIGVLGVGAVGYQYARRAANQGSGYTAEDAEQGRFELWKAGAVMLAANPLLGVGSRRFPEYAWEYYDLSHDMRGKVSHNTYVEVAATSGVVGFVTFVMMGWRLIQDLRRKRRPDATGMVDAARRATLIGLYAISLRAILDAKPHDWCFYSFCAIGIACCRILERQNQNVDQGAEQPVKGFPLARSRVRPARPYPGSRLVTLPATGAPSGRRE